MRLISHVAAITNHLILKIMNFSEMKFKEAIEVIMNNNTLREKLDSYIMDCEMDYITEKLNCFDRSCANWEFGFYNQNHLHIKNEDYSGFLNGAEKSAKYFGASTKLENAISHANKLFGTNLYEYQVKKVCRLFFEEEIESTREYVEDLCFATYSKDVEKFNNLGGDNYLECFLDHCLDDYYYDEEENEVYHKFYKVS